MLSHHMCHSIPLLCLCLAVAFALDNMTKLVVSCDSGPCWAGQFYDPKRNICLECPNKTFMDQSGHRCEGCRPCTIAHHHSHQVQLHQCTRTADTVIGCLEGFYAHHKPHELDCHPCSLCGQGQRMVEICHGEADTRCTELEAGAATDLFHRNTSGSVFYKNTMAVSLVAGFAILITVSVVLVLYCRDNNPGDDTEKQDMDDYDGCDDHDESPTRELIPENSN